MKKHLELLDSVENIITGDRFRTEITRVKKEDLKGVSKRSGWTFDWKQALKNTDLEVFKLTIENNIQVIQGLIGLSVEPDHVALRQLESAPFNKGNKKVYAGVPGNLAAFAIELSFQQETKGKITLPVKYISPEDKKTIKAFISADQQKSQLTKASRSKSTKHTHASAKPSTRSKKRLPHKHPFSEAILSPDR